MRNKKKLIIILIEIILVIVFIATYKSYVDFSLKPMTVYGFAADLDAGAKITQKDLITVEVSQSTLNKNMITSENLADIVGMYLKMDVVSNSIAYTTQLTDVNSADKFASLDLSNARVITIETDYIRSGMGDFARGDMVDLLYLASASDENGSAFTYSKVFMSGVTVYSVNTANGYAYTPHGAVTSSSATTDENGDETEISYDAIASVSLIVTPEQAEEIRVRQSTGEIEFLKRFDESETHDTLGFVIGTYGKIFSGYADAETGNLNIGSSTIVNTNSVTRDDAETNEETVMTPTVDDVQ